jgi:hypothetical protein
MKYKDIQASPKLYQTALMRKLNLYCILFAVITMASCKKESSKMANEPAWLKQDLLAYFPFNGNAKDSSGNGFDGVPNGIVQATTDRNGKSNAALYFNNGEVLTNINNTFFNKDFSISLWVQLEQFTSQYAKLIWGNDCFVMEYVRDANPRVLAFYLYTPGFGTSAFSTAVINFTSWTNITITNTNGFSSLYINGTYLNKSQTARPALGTGSTNFIKFGNAPLDAHHFKGKLDEIRFYKRSLNEEEVKYLYQK